MSHEEENRRPIEGRLQIFSEDRNMLTLSQQAMLVQVAAETSDINVKRQAMRLLEISEQPSYVVAGPGMLDVDTEHGTMSVPLGVDRTRTTVDESGMHRHSSRDVT